MGDVIMLSEWTLDHQVEETAHCEVYLCEGCVLTSEEGLSPLSLGSSVLEATATWVPGRERYDVEGLDHVPFSGEDSLVVDHEDMEPVVVPAPPSLGPEVMGEADGLSTRVRIPHDDFDAVQVLLAYGYVHQAFCLYGKADLERVDDAWELPIVDESSRDAVDRQWLDVLVFPVNLEMTEAIFPGRRAAAVKAARGVALPASALYPLPG
jgi:hypothetical protein